MTPIAIKVRSEPEFMDLIDRFSMPPHVASGIFEEYADVVGARFKDMLPDRAFMSLASVAAVESAKIIITAKSVTSNEAFQRMMSVFCGRINRDPEILRFARFMLSGSIASADMVAIGRPEYRSRVISAIRTLDSNG